MIKLLLSLFFVATISSCKYIEASVHYKPKHDKEKPPKPEPWMTITNSTQPHNKAHYNITIHDDKKKDITKHIID